MELSEVTATPQHLRRLAQQDHLSAAALERSLRVLGHLPDRAGWRGFLDVVLLLLGALFLVCGIFFFLAYNWEDLPRFARFGTLEAAILIAAAAAHWIGLDRLAGKISLTVAALLVGALMAVFGQEYQTGADSYTLFFYWALLIMGWALIASFDLLWLIVLALFNLALFFYWQAVQPGADRLFWATLFAVNAGALLLWEGVSRRGAAWMRARWFPRLAAVAAFGWVLIPTVLAIFSLFDEFLLPNQDWLAPLLYCLFLVATLYYYGGPKLDLFILTVALASLICVITSLIGRALMEGDEVFAFLLTGVAVILQATGAVMWLRRVSKQQTDDEPQIAQISQI